MFQRTDLFRMVQRWFDDADYLVTPTLSRTALPIDQDLFEPIRSTASRWASCGATGSPTPCRSTSPAIPRSRVCSGYGGEGLPIGLQIVGRFRDEASVLRAAALYEASESWLTAGLRL